MIYVSLSSIVVLYNLKASIDGENCSWSQQRRRKRRSGGMCTGGNNGY